MDRDHIFSYKVSAAYKAKLQANMLSMYQFFTSNKNNFPSNAIFLVPHKTPRNTVARAPGAPMSGEFGDFVAHAPGTPVLGKFGDFITDILCY
jgi:hypothetical protein